MLETLNQTIPMMSVPEGSVVFFPETNFLIWNAEWGIIMLLVGMVLGYIAYSKIHRVNK
jgi:hypothetical protein